MNWEKVHTVNQFWDGPLSGIADCGGKPHVYQRQFSEIEDEFTDRFWLQEADPQLVDLVLEDWTIWLRWRAAFHQKKVTLESHPALPQDRDRHEVLKLAIGDRLKIDQATSIHRRGRFRHVGEGRQDVEVAWTEVEG